MASNLTEKEKKLVKMAERYLLRHGWSKSQLARTRAGDKVMYWNLQRPLPRNKK